MKNPYFELHKEFKAEGADVIMSSGQACVLFGIAAFSKDGDWIIEESTSSCSKVLKVLENKGASYRLGVPLDKFWLSKGLTSHFDYFLDDGFRMRVDFCSRPPRVTDLSAMWHNVEHLNDIDVIDVQNLILLKKTRRVRDYNIIGTLAEVLGFNQDKALIALNNLQDYELLKNAVDKWPKEAKKSNREAVKTIVEGKPRKDTIIALAVEQDENIQLDQKRIDLFLKNSKDYQKKFFKLSKTWHKKNSSLLSQHKELIALAKESMR